MLPATTNDDTVDAEYRANLAHAKRCAEEAVAMIEASLSEAELARFTMLIEDAGWQLPTALGRLRYRQPTISRE